MTQRSRAELDELLDELRAAPTNAGEVQLIVRRPSTDEREALDSAKLSTAEGLVGDNWRARGSRQTDDGSAELDRQLTIMSARAADAVAGSRDRWALAGDQLYIDIDMSHDNLPAGSVLTIGTAAVEVTEPPHTGCQKFVQRFGLDAMRWVNGEDGKKLRLRGLNARVVRDGTVSIGDRATVERPANRTG